MAYYVSVKKNSRAMLALGPFHTHGAALSAVEPVRRFCSEKVKDGHWFAYGTARNRTGHAPGKLNDAMGHGATWLDALP